MPSPLPSGSPPSLAAHTDIRAAGWVSRLPASWRAYALLARLDRPIGAWLLFLPGLWSILLARAPWPATLRLLALFGVGSVVMRAAGCVVNDMWDRDLDRQVARTASRPLASGVLRMRQAAGLLLVLLLAGLLVLLQLNPLSRAMGAASLLLVALYPLAKRVTWWPQLVMGFTFGFGAPLGWSAATGRLGWPCVAIYAAAVLWDLGFDTIYGFQDMEDDAVVGVRSTSRRFANRARLFVGLSYAGAMLALGLAAWGAGLSGWVVPALLPGGLLLAWQVLRLDVHDPATCLRLFRLNREAGLLLAAAILAGRF